MYGIRSRSIKDCGLPRWNCGFKTRARSVASLRRGLVGRASNHRFSARLIFVIFPTLTPTTVQFIITIIVAKDILPTHIMSLLLLLIQISWSLTSIIWSVQNDWSTFLCRIGSDSLIEMLINSEEHCWPVLILMSRNVQFQQKQLSAVMLWWQQCKQ